MTKKEMRNWIAGLAIAGLMLLGLIVPKSCHADEGVALTICNETDRVVSYVVLWKDHDIEEYKGQWVPRCGGELQPGDVYDVGDDSFKLGSGLHYVLFHIFEPGSRLHIEGESSYYFNVPESRNDPIILTVDPEAKCVRH